jgi:hypothetical protein
VPSLFRRRSAAGASTDTYELSAHSVPFMSRLPSIRTVGLTLGIGRVLIGAMAVTTPVGALRFIGMDTATAARAAWLGRMTGARDTVLGAGTVASVRRDASPALWLFAGAAADLADAVAIGSAIRANRLRGVGPVATAAAAVGAAAVGTWAAAGSQRRG